MWKHPPYDGLSAVLGARTLGGVFPRPHHYKTPLVPRAVMWVLSLILKSPEAQIQSGELQRPPWP